MKKLSLSLFSFIFMATIALVCSSCSINMTNPIPSITEPTVTAPAVTAPTVTAPTVTAPAVTAPAVTTPSVTVQAK